MPDSDPRLPRPNKDPENLARLRGDALRRLDAEERVAQATVYGGPPPLDNRPGPQRDEPAPVYGGPPPANGGGSMSRRRSLWGILLAALTAIVGLIAWLLKSRRIFPQENSQAGPAAPVYGGPPILAPHPKVEEVPMPHTFTAAIKTRHGYVLTAVNGGGLGNPKSASNGVALTTGVTAAGPFESFTLVWVNKSARTFALKTHDGHFVTAVRGGGIGGPDSVKSPIHTNVRTFEPPAKFTISILPDNIHATIRTADGRHFVSAVNGGGVGGSNEIPIHTDSTTMGPEEVFRVTPAEPPTRSLPAPVYGGPVRGPRN